MATPTIDRLKWIHEALMKLKDNEWVRYEGRQVFAEATAELDDVINTFVDNSAAPVPVTLAAMTQEQVDTVVTRIAATVPPQTDGNAIVTAITAQIEQSDLAVMGAIAQSESDVITALTPPPAA